MSTTHAASVIYGYPAILHITPDGEDNEVLVDNIVIKRHPSEDVETIFSYHDDNEDEVKLSERKLCAFPHTNWDDTNFDKSHQPFIIGIQLAKAEISSVYLYQDFDSPVWVESLFDISSQVKMSPILMLKMFSY